jgi:hypothetical protein
MSTAREIDDSIARVAGGQGALDLALGEGIDRLFAPGRLMGLSYATERDYARERLGLPPRTMFDALALARVCKGRPLLRRAVAAGLVSPCKARAIAPVVAANEPGWTALAMTSTLREILGAMRAAGTDPPKDFEGESLRARMSPAQQDRLDAALERAGETLGGGVPRWQCYEALAQEWLSEHGGWAPEEEDAGGPRGTEDVGKPLPDCVAEHLAVIAEARALVEDRAPETNDPKEIEAFLLRLLEARRRHDLVFGALALRVVEGRIWAAAGFATLKVYWFERLGRSPGAFRERVWLERRMFALPALRAALVAGTLTYSKALLVAREATAESVAELIARATGTTHEQTERETTAREEKRNRAKGIRRLWAPKDVMRTIVAAILSAQRWSAGEGRTIDAGEALAVVADDFVKTWPRERVKRRSKAREEVSRRTGGRCSVPGCTLPGRHVHHIRYRSRCGTDDTWNETLLCVPHHLHGIHEGRLTVSGRAGERLVWRFANGESWITEGDDDVRRADPDRVAEPGPRRYGAAA